MKFIFAQPSIRRFEWELATVCKSLLDLGVQKSDIVLLFADDTDKIEEHFDGYDWHVYTDDRESTDYIPSLRPFLWWKYLSEDPAREKETYVYLDSDVIIGSLDIFNLSELSEKTWCCSDTVGYIGLDYLKSVTNADHTIRVMTDTVGVPIEWLEHIQDNSGGAQWVLQAPTAAYWHDVYVNSISLFNAIRDIDTSLQKWTAEMWAQLWTMYHYGIEPCVSEQLEFAWATDDIDAIDFDKIKIIHNAGVYDNTQGLFFKGDFMNFPTLADLDRQGDTGKVSDVYVAAVRAAIYGY